jgi:single-stranded DNA-binding protein
VFVGGFLRTRKWQKSGEDQYTTEIVAEDFQSVIPRSARAREADARTQESE